MREFDQNYLRLVLEIEKHIEGYVDSYYGPADLKAAVNAQPKKSAADLLADLDWLQQHVPTEDASRQRYLTGIFRAMDCTLRLLNGEQFEYLDEVERLYDIRPQLVDEKVFTQAHARLDAILPAGDDLPTRMEAWVKQYEIPGERIFTLLELLRDETRARTVKLVELVPGESMAVQLTSNQPWSGYNWFKGNAHSLIEFNTDIPLSGLRLLDIFAHEAYPGHHTEHQLKEQHLYKARGYAEYACGLLNSPAAVISEGIATTALEIIFPGDSAYEWMATVMFPAADLPATEASTLAQVLQAQQAIKNVRSNAAILYHTGQLNEAQTLDYYRTYALYDEKRAQLAWRFITNPLFRSYIFTYTEGYDLITQAAGENKWPLFQRLLHEEALPSELHRLVS